MQVDFALLARMVRARASRKANDNRPNMKTKRGASVCCSLWGLNLDDLGLKVLGFGCYGVAALHKATGLVLKVSFSKEDGTMGVLAEAARYFQTHGKAPSSLPEVYNFGVEKTYWFAVMEHIHVGYQIARSSHYDYAMQMGFYEDIKELCGHPKDLCPSSLDSHSGNWGYTADFRRVIFDPFDSSWQHRTFTAPAKQKKQYGPQQQRWS